MLQSSVTPKIYELGVWIGYLEATVDNNQANWGSVREALQALIAYKTVEGLEFVGTDAQSQLLSLARTYKYSYGRLVTKNDLTTLSDIVKTWYGRLEEVKKRWIILIPNLSLDVSKLTAGAKTFFSLEEWDRLNELEHQGLNEAANCMLSNNFTAAEFMALRTVESVLRRWYAAKKGKITQLQADVINFIDTEYPDNKKRPKEISALFHLKNRRNAIAHPDEISTAQNANATFVYVIDTCKLASLLACNKTGEDEPENSLGEQRK
jgi:hypothetical protein